MEAFRDQFTSTELLSNKEVLYDEATEEWYAQRETDEVEREERNCMRLVRQFCHLMKEYRGRFFTYVLFQSPTRSIAAHLETSVLDDLSNGATKVQLELDWITWQRDYALNSRTSILEALQYKL